MDEPLSNLDAKLRSQMRYEIQKLHQRLQTTTIYVTHDQTEAMTLATRLVVLNDGVIQQIGAPKEVYDYPENTFVGGFIGSPSMNFLYGTLRSGQFIIGNDSFAIPEEKGKELREHNDSNKCMVLGIRPEAIHDEPAFINASPDTSFSAVIDTVELLGAETCLYARLNDYELTVRVSSNARYDTGDTIKLAFDMTKASFFDADTENRIYG
ncbi:hypothetical protein GCM10028778_00030 [Barrientosiimonas marina]